MAEETYHLRAMDEIGGQAIYEHSGRWFRISFDGDWLPVELNNRSEALRCIFVAPYEYRDEIFTDANALIASVEARWSRSFDVEDVPLSEVVHLFPVALQRAWETANQLQRARDERSEYQNRRLLEQEAQRRKDGNSTRRLGKRSPVFEFSPVVDLEIASSGNVSAGILNRLITHSMIKRMRSRWPEPQYRYKYAMTEDMVNEVWVKLLRREIETDRPNVVRIRNDSLRSGPLLVKRVEEYVTIVLNGYRESRGAPKAFSNSNAVIGKHPDQRLSTAPEGVAEELRSAINRVLKTLSYRERETLKLRFGLGDGYSYTQEEIGHIFKVSARRIRAIERKAISKLQQPNRACMLAGFVSRLRWGETI